MSDRPKELPIVIKIPTTTTPAPITTTETTDPPNVYRESLHWGKYICLNNQ